MIRVVHYINQFFGQIGGEEKAGQPPLTSDNPVGPGILLKNLLGSQGELVGTVICGDNYFAENTEQAAEEVLDLIASYKPDLVIAGPAFNAGRYGPACAEVCLNVQEKLSIPAITGLFKENPAVDTYRRQVPIIKTGDSAGDMRRSMLLMVTAGIKLAKGEQIEHPDELEMFKKGIRKNVFTKETGARRAVNMVLDLVHGREVQTELPMPSLDQVDAAPSITDLSKSVVALVTEGGITYKGNPDRLESSRASKFLKLDIGDKQVLSTDEFETIHGGYNGKYVNEDIHRLVPLDVMKELELENVIGEIHPILYATTGNGTTIETARTLGQNIAKALKNDGVQAVILTST